MIYLIRSFPSLGLEKLTKTQQENWHGFAVIMIKLVLKTSKPV